MRLARLELEAYGAFSGLALAFRPEARLHVVYGPNEAGKSTALAAVSDLLFGFEKRTDVAFRFKTGDLRLGGEVVASDGSRMRFRRRKGDKQTLLDMSDAPLRDDALAPFLGGLGRDLFARAFGLDAERLRLGGDALLSADGEAGASLFAAASGMRGLEALRTGLEAEADAIFAPRASKDRRFYKAQARYDAARKAAKDRELRTGDWQALNVALEDRSATYEELAKRRRAVVEEIGRVERLLRGAPIVREIDALVADAAEFSDLPDLSPAQVADLAHRLDDASAAREAARRAGLDHEAALTDANAVTVDASALERAADIERLHAASGADAKARADLPGVERETAAYTADLARLAGQLGLSDPDSVERSSPTAGACAELRDLIDKGRGLDEDDRVRARQLDDERETLAALEAGRGGAALAADPRPFREALEGFRGSLRTLARGDELRSAHGAEARAVAEAASRLAPPVADLDALAAVSLPAPSVVERAAREQEIAAERVARAVSAVQDVRAELSELGAELERFDRGPPIASPEALAAARQAREAQWLRLRGHLVGSERLATEDLVARVSDHERATAVADRLADGQAADAERVARRRECDRRRAETARREGACVEAEGKARSALDAARASWMALWSAVRVTHDRPEAASGWLAAVTGLLARREKNAATAAEVARLDALDARLRPDMARLAEAAGVAISADATAFDLAEPLEARLAALSNAWTAAADVEGRIADVRRRIGRLDRAGAPAKAERDAWEARWRGALPAAGLAADTSLAAAAAALAAWEKAPDLLRERASRMRRVDGIHREVKRFRSETAALVADLAPDLADLAPDGAVRRLNERLGKAREAEARRAEAARRLDEAARKLAEAGRAESAADAAVGLAAAALPEGADLADALDRFRRRAAKLVDLAKRRNDLARQTDGVSEADLRNDLDGFDPDVARGRLADLADEDRHLEQAKQQAFLELERAKDAREQREQGVGSELAVAEQRSAEAELAASARDWAVLKLAGLLISEAIARHRAERRDPLVDRASVLFETMTGGAFKAIAEDFGDDDARRLVGRRVTGELTPVSGLSEGTRDQFYLALRLAFLEDYAARAEPAPFIGDDLLASFDDHRTACGLRALAEIGAMVQPILFTHHRSVVESARKTLGEAADVIEIDAVTR